MPTPVEEIRAAGEQRFARVARSPKLEQKFPVGPASAKQLGYDPNKFDTPRPGDGIVLRRPQSARLGRALCRPDDS
jgi:hypothetical protein